MSSLKRAYRSLNLNSRRKFLIALPCAVTAIAALWLAAHATAVPRIFAQTPTPPRPASLSSCVAAPAGMVSWWKAEGNADDSQDSNKGRLQNGAGFATAEVGQGFSLNGTDQYVGVPDSPGLSITGPMTIDAWINANDNMSEHAIVEKYDGGGSNGYFLRLSDAGHVVAGMCDASTCSFATGATLVTTGTFHHVAAIFDGTNLQVYLDGILDGSASSVAPTDGTNPLTIGARGGSVGNFFTGIIDEVEIFNRALSATEVASIFAAGSNGKCPCTPPPDGMVSWWRAEGDAVDTKDGNDGTLLSGVTFAPGEVGQAFSFPGNGSSYVNVPNAANLQFTSAFTLDAWIYPTNLNVPPTICSKFNGPQGTWAYEFGLTTNGALILFISTNGSDFQSVFTGTGLVSSNQWQHVAVTFNAGSVLFFLNGSQVGSGTFSSSSVFPGTADLAIGSNTGGAPFTGLIDELEAFNRALGVDEIAAIYNAAGAGKCRPITLSAAGRKVGGVNTVRLTWSGANSANIDIYRNGSPPIATVPNTGTYTDSTGDTGRARYSYQVCEAGTATCSNRARVQFRQ